jgi:hypothetical protein
VIGDCHWDGSPWWVVLFLIVAAPLILSIVLSVLLLRLVASTCIYMAVWCWWSPRGRDILFAHSDNQSGNLISNLRFYPSSDHL